MKDQFDIAQRAGTISHLANIALRLRACPESPRERNTGILPVRPAGFQPAATSIRRQDARAPHSQDGCVPTFRTRS